MTEEGRKENKTHYIVFSHGFGVKKDDRGLFTDIAEALPSTEAALFDYNKVNENNHTLTVAPLNSQARKLISVVGKIREEDPEAVIDLVCHSQGCLVAAIACPDNIQKTFFLAPPAEVDVNKLVEHFKNRPGSEINLDGESRLIRNDGSTTVVPKEYWKTLKGLNVTKLYNGLSKKTDLIILQAAEDEVLGLTTFNGVGNVKIETLRADHNFTGKARAKVIELIKNFATNR